MKLAKELSERSIQSRFITSSEDINRIISPSSSVRQGFVVYEGCYDVVDEVMARENQLLLFKDYNIWLFIDDEADCVAVILRFTR